MVISEVDYYNLLYLGLPFRMTQKFYLVQNATAWVLTGTPHTTRIHPALFELHWLPVEYQTSLKVLVLTFKALKGQGPMYHQDCLSRYTPK